MKKTKQSCNKFKRIINQLVIKWFFLMKYNKFNKKTSFKNKNKKQNNKNNIVFLRLDQKIKRIQIIIKNKFYKRIHIN